MPNLRPYKSLSDDDIKKLILHSEECMLFSQSPATIIRLSRVRALCMDEQQERIDEQAVTTPVKPTERITFMSTMTDEHLYSSLMVLRTVPLVPREAYTARVIREKRIALREKELQRREAVKEEAMAEALAEAEAEAAYEEAAEAEDEEAAEEAKAAKAAKSDSPEIREKNPIHPVIGATDFPVEAPRVRKYPLVTAALRDMDTRLIKSAGQGDYALLLTIDAEYRSPAYQELVNLFMAKTYISRNTMDHSVCIFLFHNQLLPFMQEVLADR